MMVHSYDSIPIPQILCPGKGIGRFSTLVKNTIQKSIQNLHALSSLLLITGLHRFFRLVAGWRCHRRFHRRI